MAEGPAHAGLTVSLVVTLGWQRRWREPLKVATWILIHVSGTIYLKPLHVPYTATSQQLWQLLRNKKCALSSSGILYSKLCPAADGSFLKVTYWLWVHVGRVWLCSVFWAHHLLSHSHCHLRPRQYQIGSSSVENYEQIKKDYSCEMNQTTVSTFSISFGIKHLLQFIFVLFWAYSYEGRDEALQSSIHCLPALTKQSYRWLNIMKEEKDGSLRAAST